MDTVAAGCRTVAAVMDAPARKSALRSCKLLVGQVVEHAQAVEEDPRSTTTCPASLWTSRRSMAAIREQGLRSVSRSSPPGAGVEDKSKMGLNSLLKMMWADEVIEEQDAKFVNDSGQHPEGRFSVSADGRSHFPEQLRRIADVAEKYNIPHGQAHRRSTDRSARRAQGGPAQGLGRPRHAVRVRAARACRSRPAWARTSRFGVGDSTKLGVDIESRYQGQSPPR